LSRNLGKRSSKLSASSPRSSIFSSLARRWKNACHLLDYHVKVGAIVDITERVNLDENNNIDLLNKKKNHELRRSH
jgi:hypothetical protein